MPNRLTLAPLAFGAASAIQARLGGDSSAAKPAVKDAPGALRTRQG